MKSFATDAALKNEYYRDHYFSVDMVELHLKDSQGRNSALYLNSGGIDIVYDSPTAPTSGNNTYTAQGDFIGFSPLSEDFDVKVGKFSIYLSAINNNYISKFIDGEVEGKRVVIYKAFFNLTTFEIISSPILMFDGLIYNFAISEGAKSCQINVDCSSLFADFERTAGRKTNNWSNWLYQGSDYDNSMDKSGWVGQTEFKWGRI
jgi:hypothetical protein